MMNVAMNPARNLVVLAQLGTLGAWARGMIKNSSENLGFPQAVKNEFKGDYVFRDVFMCWVNLYLTEVSYRLVDHYYGRPNFVKILGLDTLKSQYGGGQAHLPLPGTINKNAVKNLSHLPTSLINRMHGSAHDPRTYYLIPDLLEQEHIPKLQEQLKKAGGKTAEVAKLTAEIEESKLMAHHMRRMFNSNQYLTETLVKQTKTITKAEATLIEDTLKEMREVAKLIAEAQDFQKGNRRKPLSSNKSLKELQSGLKKLESNAGIKQNAKFYKELFGLSDEALMAKIKGSSPIKDMRNEGFRGAMRRLFSPKFTQDKAFAAAKDELFSPFFKGQVAKAGLNGERAKFLEKIAMDLAQNHVANSNLKKMLKAGEFYLKLPLSVFAIFVIYGLIANTFDAKVLQPFQREVVKKRGHAKDFVMPMYLGIFPAAATFLTLYKLPGFQKALGYVGSFAVAGAAGLTAFMGSAALMFSYLFTQGKKRDAAAQLNKAQSTSLSFSSKPNPFKAQSAR